MVMTVLSFHSGCLTYCRKLPWFGLLHVRNPQCNRIFTTEVLAKYIKKYSWCHSLHENNSKCLLFTSHAKEQRANDFMSYQKTFFLKAEAECRIIIYVLSYNINKDNFVTDHYCSIKHLEIRYIVKLNLKIVLQNNSKKWCHRKFSLFTRFLIVLCVIINILILSMFEIYKAGVRKEKSLNM